MDLHAQFENPAMAYRQAPFWFWNHDLTPDLLDWQVDQMHEKGLGGFVMHARHGLITPYLSDHWFDCIRACCEKARRLGMLAWAYDERDWPSGPAAGAVIADPAHRLHYLRLDTRDVEGPVTLNAAPDAVALYAAQGDAPLARVEPGTSLPAGPWHVAEAIAFECPGILWFDSYLDTLNPAACRAFLDSTYARHESVLGDLRQLGLAGFFTDEPAFSTYPDDLSRVPWTSRLPEAFRERHGYDLLAQLPALFLDTPNGAQVRFDYWDAAAALFEDAFFRQLSQWCQERGLQLIGHPLGEEPLFYQFRCLGNIFRHLKHLHMPGLDHLTIHVGKDNPACMNPKMVQSAALMAGRERVMTETFGESGWRLTLREMKWMTDWQFANGVNYIIPHAFYYSVARRRKKDSPPSEFYQAPFWKYYRCFADYTARVSAALTGGAQVAPVAVLYPMASVWADFIPGDAIPPSVQELEDAFWRLGAALQRQHRDFIVIDETDLADAVVEGARFRIRGLEFDTLVLPQMTALRAPSIPIIETIAATCPLLAVHPRPLRVLSAKDGANWDPAACPNIRAIADLEDSLAAAFAGIEPDVTMDNAPDVQCLHRKKDGKDLYFFANTAEEAVKTTVTLRATGLAEIWDAETGARATAPGQRLADGRLTLPLDLPYAGSALVVVDPAQPPRETAPAECRIGNRLRITDPLWQFMPEGGNFFALTHWELRMQQHQHVTELRYLTRFTTPDHIANLRLLLDGVPAQAYNVNDAARPIMSGETDAVILLDSEPVTRELPWEIDPHFRVLDLQPGLRPGAHTLEIIIKNNGWIPQPGLEEFAWLAGDFCLDRRGDVPCLIPLRGVKTGPWEEQGYPHFSGTGAYYIEVDLPPELTGKRVYFNAGDVRHLLELEVNAQSAGVRAWPPYRLEITPLLIPGKNQFVIKITNSALNFFEGPDKNFPSGLLTDPWLEIED